MKCRRTRHLLLDFVDGLGNEALHAEVDRHLAECTECEAFAAETTRSLALLRRAPVEALDENFNWKVRLAIHREQKAMAKGAASVGPWVKAWNFRYAASTGIAFAIVLGAGVVAMKTVMPTGTTVSPTRPSTAVRSQVQAGPQVAENVTSRSAATQRPRPNPGSNGAILVSDGGNSGASDVASGTRGAIDRYAQEVAIDSLIDSRLVGMTPEMRTRCIQRQIHRLQSQLERQPAPAVKP